MKVSVIIPVYNVEAYVEKCISSVAAQSFEGQIECIIVDDCSTDRSMDVVSGYISGYQGSVEFKVIHHEQNRGLSAARNTGMDYASGEWFYFLDSDDYITRDCLKLLTDKVNKYSGVEMVHGSITSIPYHEYYDKIGLYGTDILHDNRDIRDRFYDLSINASDKLISSAYIKSYSLKFREDIVHEDELWSYYLYKHLNKIAIVHDCTYVHVIREGSIMTSLTKKKDYESWKTILTELSHEIADPCASPLEKYYLTAAYSMYDGSQQWTSIADRFKSSLKSKKNWSELAAYSMMVKTHDYRYKYWLRGDHRGYIMGLLTIARYEVGRALKRSCHRPE